jgi:hypothetical protein
VAEVLERDEHPTNAIPANSIPIARQSPAGVRGIIAECRRFIAYLVRLRESAPAIAAIAAAITPKLCSG